MNVRVIGIGNVLMSDEGFGPYLIRVLEAFYEMPHDVHLIDAGTPGIDLAATVADADFVMLVDTLRCGGPAGEVRVLQADEILDAARLPASGPCHPSIVRVLEGNRRLRGGPADILVVGVVPDWVATGVRLSRPVRSALVPAIGVIIGELERLGYRVPMRALPRQPDIWWERDEELVAL